MSKFTRGDAVTVVVVSPLLDGIVNAGDVGRVVYADDHLVTVDLGDKVWAFRPVQLALTHGIYWTTPNEQPELPSAAPLKGISKEEAAWPPGSFVAKDGELTYDGEKDPCMSTVVVADVTMRDHVKFVDWMMRSMDTATIHAVLGELNKRLGMTSNKEYRPDTAKDGDTVMDITKDICGRR